MKDEHDTPAFPVAEDYETADKHKVTRGISIRDYFAAFGLTGLLSAKHEARREDIALEAYHIADEMIRIRRLGR